MPQFTPSALKTAKAPITVKPAGLSCQAELYLVSGTTKVATSGTILFASTGVAQDITFPITMPSTTGTYNVYLDILASGILIGAYQAIEDVVIALAGAKIAVTLAPPSGDCDYVSVEYWNPNTSLWQLESPTLSPGQTGGLRITARAWLTTQSYNVCWTGLVVTAPDGMEIIREAGPLNNVTVGTWVYERNWVCSLAGIYQAVVSIYASKRY